MAKKSDVDTEAIREAARATVSAPAPSRPPLTLPQRKPRVGDSVLYWRIVVGVGVTHVGADVYGPGNMPVIEDGKSFDTVHLNVHEIGGMTWARDCGYSVKPRVGCWCFVSDLK